jgi:hypothetical protein
MICVCLCAEDIERQKRDEVHVQVRVRWGVVLLVSHFQVVIVEFKNAIKLHIPFLSKIYLSFCLSLSEQF